MEPIIIGDNKFIWDGKVLRVYDVTNPSHEVVISKDELKELIEINQVTGEFYG